ncbi:hypothetical protein IV203_034624 [Nitzschia inconspicua]|uniref:Fe2OG dioxygenase domain-containing protein n=1 Tax=Nitzschia inconspicua TaxID=303405 RepID=A0A9K3LEQ2_9STRA|nr:hypothetical protein IV203_002710 [Nitzschia inconspicua]KAG7359526.1 hypothetical protein IV203_034624 [Nitzschia inconspicua]
MGQHCSTLTCHHVEHQETGKISRTDSLDPVMYDLMRKSIQATSAVIWNQEEQELEENDTVMMDNRVVVSQSGKQRRPVVGQSHLLYKNNNNNNNNNNTVVTGSKKSSPRGGVAVAAAQSNPIQRKSHGSFGEPASSDIMAAEKNHTIRTPRRGMERRSCGKMGSGTKTTDATAAAAAAVVASSSTITNGASKESNMTIVTTTDNDNNNVELLLAPSTNFHLKCPTRLLIRRRSLRVVEEGGGTHIYAIRYPEDTSPTILSEQAVPFPLPVRQEQCPSSSQTKSTPTPTTTIRTASTTTKATVLPPVAANSKSTTTTSTTSTTTTTTSSSSLTAEIQSKRKTDSSTLPSSSSVGKPTLPVPVVKTGNVGDIFAPSSMAAPPRKSVLEWVTVSDEHHIYVADVGLTSAQCDQLVATTEQVCKGQYAAYTYAKQTLGCREFPTLAYAALQPVHTIVHAIINKFPITKPSKAATTENAPPPSSSSSSKTSGATQCKDSSTKKSGNDDVVPSPSTKNGIQDQTTHHHLQLDDREPHIVKYDVTRKERQKLDMHTDKSEWTFLIALSNGCGVDYEGGGTYFECLDATIHIQRGHALVFPGKLRHCGQKITSGLRFLLVGFLVDKQNIAPSGKNGNGGKQTTSKTPLVPSPDVSAAKNDWSIPPNASKKTFSTILPSV